MKKYHWIKFQILSELFFEPHYSSFISKHFIRVQVVQPYIHTDMAIDYFILSERLDFQVNEWTGLLKNKVFTKRGYQSKFSWKHFFSSVQPLRWLFNLLVQSTKDWLIFFLHLKDNSLEKSFFLLFLKSSKAWLHKVKYCSSWQLLNFNCWLIFYIWLGYSMRIPSPVICFYFGGMCALPLRN